MEGKHGRRNRARKATVVVLGIIAVALLALIVAVVVPIVTHESAGGSGQETPSGFLSQVQAHGDDGRTRTLSVTNTEGSAADVSVLTVGDTIVVHGSGYDAAIGIYVAVCQIPEVEGERPSPCLGEIPEGPQSEDATAAMPNAWVTNSWAWRSFATHTYIDDEEGTFSVELLIPDPVDTQLNCREIACGIFTRADHTALNDRVQDLYVPVAFAAR